jgi:phosphonate transport system substrate-binding protein
LAIGLAGCATGETAAEPTPTETESVVLSPAGVDTTGWPEKLVFGAVPSEEASSLVESYEKILAVLEAELGIEIEFFQATDYAGIIEGQVSGKVDLAQYGPFSYVLAGIRGASLEVAGVMTDGPDIEPGYQSYGITLASNDSVNGIEDFGGKTVCFVDPASTSGFLYPSEGLLSAGIDPEADVTPIFAGGHDASVLAVANGDCEVGFAFDAMVDKNLIESGDLKEGVIKTVWKSEVIAGSPLAMQSGLPQTLKDEIRRIIIEKANVDALVASGICDSVENCGITDEKVWGYVSKDDSFYDGVRKVCEVTGSSKCK